MKKTINVILFFAAFVAATATISSCTKTCDSGFEGSDCKTQFNTKFAGSYTVKDTSLLNGATSVYNYTMVVTAPSSSPIALNFANFGGFGAGTTLAGTANTSTTFTITPGNLAGVQITTGAGSISGNALSFTYTSYDSTTGTATSHAVGLK